MRVTTEELERCEILLTIEIEPDQEQNMLKKAAKKIARQVRIPGFRPGKAPYNTVVRRFGLDAVQQEALEDSAEKLINDALVEANLRPFAQISFDGISWNPLQIKIKVPGKPKVELGDYRKLRLDSEPIEVTDDDVAAALSRMQEQQATWAPVERPSQENDLITISVVEKNGDEILAEHDSIEYELTFPEEDHEANEDSGDQEDSEVSGTDFQPDLTTPLLGLSAGDEKTFSIDYPDNFQDGRYAGKSIDFTVEVLSVKEKELDPLDDEFAQSFSDFDTLDELKADIKKNLLEMRQREANQKLGEELLDKIIEEAETIEWPVALEEESVEAEIERFTQQFSRYGLDLDSYLQIEKKTEAEFREEIRKNVVMGLKRSAVLGKLTEIEKLSVSNSEVLERAKSIADSIGDDKVWQYLLGSEAQQNRMANDMLTGKVFDRLAAIAKGEAPEPGADIESDDSDDEQAAEGLDDDSDPVVETTETGQETTKETSETKDKV